MKILIIQQKKIGDVLISTILFEALRQKFSDAELHYLVNSHTLPVLENNPYIDKIVEFKPEYEQSKTRFYKFLKSLSKENYQIVIDVYVKISSGLMTYFCKANQQIAYHKNYSAFLYSHNIKRKLKSQYHSSLAIENRLKLLEPLGISFKTIQPKLYLSKQEISEGKLKLKENGISFENPLFMVNILGSIPQKTYPKKYMAELLNFCVEEVPYIQILFNYIPSQKIEAQKVYELTSKKTQSQIYFDVFGKSLREFMTLTVHCDALIGNEGGGTNIAKALNVSSFAIFSTIIDKNVWFGENEKPKHQAVHPADFMDFPGGSTSKRKENSHLYYKKMIPELIKPKLKTFLQNLQPNKSSYL